MANVSQNAQDVEIYFFIQPRKLYVQRFTQPSAGYVAVQPYLAQSCSSHQVQ